MARIGVAAGRPAEAGRRRHGQPLLRVGPDRGADGGRPHPRRRGRRDDRRRRRVDEHGADDAATSRRSTPTIFARDENVGIAYGMGLTAEKVAQQWKVSREAQDAFALESHQQGADGAAGRRVRRRDRRRSKSSSACPTSRPASVRVEDPHRRRSTKARAPTPRSKAWPSCARCSRPRARSRPATARRRRDGAGALILASEKAVKQFDLKPLARFVSFAARGVPPEIMGIGPIEAIPAALRYAGLTQRRHRLDRAERGVRGAVAGGDQHARPRSGEGQPDGRRDRARPPARRDRRDPLGDRRPRAAPQQPEVRHGHDVRRHRPGRGGHLRARLSAERLIDRNRHEHQDGHPRTASRRSRSRGPRRRTRSRRRCTGRSPTRSTRRATTPRCAPCCSPASPASSPRATTSRTSCSARRATEDPPSFAFMKALIGCDKPVVAAVTGAAIGIGTTMLLHCDFVYVSDEARLAMPFVSLGLVPEFALEPDRAAADGQRARRREAAARRSVHRRRRGRVRHRQRGAAGERGGQACAPRRRALQCPAARRRARDQAADAARPRRGGARDDRRRGRDLRRSACRAPKRRKRSAPSSRSASPTSRSF